MNDQKEWEIDFWDLFVYLKKKIALILALTFGFGLLGFFGTKLFRKPQYQVKTVLYVQNRTADYMDYRDYQVSSQLAYDCISLIKSRSVTHGVIDELDLEISEAALLKKIDVQLEDYSRVLTVTITDTDPQRAMEIANSVGRNTAATVNRIIGSSTVTVVDEATKPTAPSGPNAAAAALFLAGIALVGSVAVLCMIRCMSRTIRTEEDVNRWMGLSVLGAIPAIDNPKSKKSPLRRFFQHDRARNRRK